MSATRTLLVSNLRVPLDTIEGDVCFLAQKTLRQAGILPSGATARIYRRSVDARKRDRITLVYSVAVTGAFSSRDLERAKKLSGISLMKESMPLPVHGDTPLFHPPVVVGSGPAGLFCALILAEEGYRPILIERGGSVSERREVIRRFSRERILDTETNVQFGAGGAGTFSDGKLVTRVGDPMTAYVLDTFCTFGAPDRVRTDARPHIGTDVLTGIVDRMIARIESLGGEVRFHTRLDGLVLQGDHITGIRTTKGEIPCEALVLAIGHSARDTYRMLFDTPVLVEPKPFSVGVRVEHLQADIDQALYGDFAGHPALGAAEYHLSHDTARRGVYSFCMCPGGFVMPAASQENTVVVNGMSNAARDGINANSAIAVSVFREDYGNTPQRAIAFQERIEKDAFVAGGNTYAVPLTTMGDFLCEKRGTKPSRIQPTYMDGQAYACASPDDYLPDFVTGALRGGLSAFEKQIRGFTAPDAILSGAETRTSAPVRILREAESRTAIGVSNLYPCGEGAGYAGGITSAALDGIHTALALMRTYRPL